MLISTTELYSRKKMEFARLYVLLHIWLLEVTLALSGTTDTFVLYKSPLDYFLNDSLDTTVPATSVAQCAKACSAIGCHSFVFTDKDADCFNDSTTYKGTRSITWSGRTCQRWNTTAPHWHDYFGADKYPDDSVHAAENYCRDPTNSVPDYTPWCYTTDPDIRWEFCDLVLCMEDQCRLYNKHEEPSVAPNLSKAFQFFLRQDGSDQRCYRGDSEEYTGTLNTTMEGITCQRWDSQTPHDHSRTDVGRYPETNITLAQNYCRDPDDSGFPWCYTVDPNVRYQPCILFKCV